MLVCLFIYLVCIQAAEKKKMMDKREEKIIEAVMVRARARAKGEEEEPKEPLRRENDKEKSKTLP